MKYLIKGGRVIDPATKTDQTLDLLVDGGIIKKIGKNITAPQADAIEAHGKIVSPGFVDMHTHLREPGREDKETVRTGTRASLRCFLQHRQSRLASRLPNDTLSCNPARICATASVILRVTNASPRRGDSWLNKMPLLACNS